MLVVDESMSEQAIKQMEEHPKGGIMNGLVGQ